MILKTLKSEPSGLFDEIRFHNGINFIFGKKAVDDSKKSLNGIGKSLILDIIDFCLGSQGSERLKKAKGKAEIGLSSYSAVLEFEIDGKLYAVKRSFEKTDEMIITSPEGEKSQVYKISEGRAILCDLIFSDQKYTGNYHNSWLRQLLPFFIKIQSPKKSTFSDPIEYLDGMKAMRLMQFHLFFLGINNSLSSRNLDLVSQIKSKGKAIKEIEAFITESYGLEDIKLAANELDKTNREVKELEIALQSFKLSEQYSDAEATSNNLTKRIKSLLLENYEDEAKLKAYVGSCSLAVDFDSRQIRKIYAELNETLGENIQKSLEDAIKFRKNIVSSRQEFLQDEIKKLEGSIKRREGELKAMEEERSAIYRFLNSKEAIKDLSEAYLRLSKKREQITELSGKIGLYSDLVQEEAELKAESAGLYAEMVKFISSVKVVENQIREIFINIYNSIYSDFKDQGNFGIIPKERKDQKVDIVIDIPSGLSKGKNHGKSLIYDLTILLKGISDNRNLPRFLIHDGIFDGVDRGHLVHLYNFLNELSKKFQFQYILTINEEGVLNDDNFGSGAKELTSEKIESEAVVVLTPENKLFKQDF